MEILATPSGSKVNCKTLAKLVQAYNLLLML